jgi:hypothetical protein
LYVGKKIKDFIEKPAGQFLMKNAVIYVGRKDGVSTIFDSPIYVVLITSIKQEMRKQIKRQYCIVADRDKVFSTFIC